MTWLVQDEAFELGRQWANIYDEGSDSRKLLTSLFDSFLLVNVVRNDFRNPDEDALFKPFFSAGQRPLINGLNDH